MAEREETGGGLGWQKAKNMGEGGWGGGEDQVGSKQGGCGCRTRSI